MTKPKFIRKNWYGFDHAAVNKQFSGGLTFLNSFCIKDEEVPVTVYKAHHPDKSKGHKKYMLIHMQGAGGMVRGMNVAEMKKERYRMAIHCLKCNEIIFSASRHDFSTCSCENVIIDGGKDYTKCGWTDEKAYKMFMIDLLTGKPKLSPQEKHAKKFKTKLKGIVNE